MKTVLFAVLIPAVAVCLADFLANRVRKDRGRFMVEVPLGTGQEKRKMNDIGCRLD
jgi:hypothetical protein